MIRHHALFVSLACAGTLLWGCGGNSPSSPTPQLVTEELVGAITNCNGDLHAFTTGEGTINVTLLSTTPSTSFNVVMCPATTATYTYEIPDCTFNFDRIDTGQTLETKLKGGSHQPQNLKFFTIPCSISPVPFSNPVSNIYRASVTHVK